MHQAIGRAIHRIIGMAIGTAAKSVAKSIYEANTGPRSNVAASGNTVDSSNTKSLREFIASIKTDSAAEKSRVRAEREVQEKQELLWYANLTPSQQKALARSYQDGSYKFRRRNPRKAPLSPAQLRDISDPQPIPLKLRFKKFKQNIALILILTFLFYLLTIIFR